MSRDGYGKCGRKHGGKVYHKAHRLYYAEHYGRVPEGMTLDHLCRVRACVNPHHMEPVTHAENCERGDLGGPMRRRTHCKNGHEFTNDNTTIDSRGARMCKACKRAANRRRKSNNEGTTNE